jgi:hypothetical protein
VLQKWLTVKVVVLDDPKRPFRGFSRDLVPQERARVYETDVAPGHIVRVAIWVDDRTSPDEPVNRTVLHLVTGEVLYLVETRRAFFTAWSELLNLPGQMVRIDVDQF